MIRPDVGWPSDRDPSTGTRVPRRPTYFFLRAGLSCSATSSSAPAEPISSAPCIASSIAGGPDRDRGLADRFADDHLLVPLVRLCGTGVGQIRAALREALGDDESGDPLGRLEFAQRLDPTTGLGQGPRDGSCPAGPHDRIDRHAQQLIAAIGQERRQDGHADAADDRGRRLEFAAHPGDLEPAVEVVLADRPDDRTEQRDVLRGLDERRTLRHIIDARGRDHVTEDGRRAPRPRLRRPHA